MPETDPLTWILSEVQWGATDVFLKMNFIIGFVFSYDYSGCICEESAIQSVRKQTLFLCKKQDIWFNLPIIILS